MVELVRGPALRLRMPSGLKFVSPASVVVLMRSIERAQEAQLAAVAAIMRTIADEAEAATAGSLASAYSGLPTTATARVQRLLAVPVMLLLAEAPIAQDDWSRVLPTGNKTPSATLAAIWSMLAKLDDAASDFTAKMAWHYDGTGEAMHRLCSETAKEIERGLDRPSNVHTFLAAVVGIELWAVAAHRPALRTLRSLAATNRRELRRQLSWLTPVS